MTLLLAFLAVSTLVFGILFTIFCAQQQRQHMQHGSSNRTDGTEMGAASRRQASARTGDGEYVCTVCEARYERKRELDTHTRLRHGNKPFRCPLCGTAAYATEAQLRSHVDLRHADAAAATNVAFEVERAVTQGRALVDRGNGDGPDHRNADAVSAAVPVAAIGAAEYDALPPQNAGGRKPGSLAALAAAPVAPAAVEGDYDHLALPSGGATPSPRSSSPRATSPRRGSVSHHRKQRRGPSRSASGASLVSSSKSSGKSSSKSSANSGGKRSASRRAGLVADPGATFASSQLTELTSETPSSQASNATFAAAHLAAVRTPLYEQVADGAPVGQPGQALGEGEYTSLPIGVGGSPHYGQLEMMPAGAVNPSKARSYGQTTLTRKGRHI